MPTYDVSTPAGKANGPLMRTLTAAQWSSLNPVLLNGEEAYESDTGLWKIGTGATAFNSLPYQPRRQALVAALVNQSGSNVSVAATTLTRLSLGVAASGTLPSGWSIASGILTVPAGLYRCDFLAQATASAARTVSLGVRVIVSGTTQDIVIPASNGQISATNQYHATSFPFRMAASGTVQPEVYSSAAFTLASTADTACFITALATSAGAHVQ